MGTQMQVLIWPQPLGVNAPHYALPCTSPEVMESLIGPADYLHQRHKAAAQLKAFISHSLASVHTRMVLPGKRLCSCTHD
jgi:hypothetical protein